MTSGICSEPHHTKGPSPKPCRICCMPVCEGCMVKSSFAKHEVTLQMCCVYFCKECWISRNSHGGRHLEPFNRTLGIYQQSAGEKNYCTCSARDKWLCLGCKQTQISRSRSLSAQCAGQECSNVVQPSGCGGRVCLLCGLTGGRGRETSRREYDSMHLSARLYSAVHDDPSDFEDYEVVEAESNQPANIDLNLASGISEFEDYEVVEAEANDPKYINSNLASGTGQCQEKHPMATVKVGRRKTERMKLLKTILKKMYPQNAKRFLIHTRGKAFQGYSRI